MVDKISTDTKKVIGHSIKSFGNLLKEFPKIATDNFVYDDSTLKKIGDASNSLNQWNNQLERIANQLDDKTKDEVKVSLNVLTQLMDELPKNSNDEFWYDRTIHQMVEDARETIYKLDQIIS